MQEVKVWDLFVRILHWSLVAGVIGAWITREGDEPLHIQLGYAVLGIVLAPRHLGIFPVLATLALSIL